MLDLSSIEISNWVAAYLYPFFRISAFLTVAPVLGSQTIPKRVRVGLAFLIAIILAPLLPPLPLVDALSPESIVITLHQMLIGLGLGFIFLIFTHIFVIAAQMAAMQMGLGFASMNDPSSGVNTTILSQFFILSVTLMLLVSNAHLVILEVLVESFYTIPIAATSFSLEDLWMITQLGTWMFASGVIIVLPAIVTLLLVNFAFGAMTKAAPQLNIFALGFPVSMLIGIFSFWLLFNQLLGHYQKFIEETIFMMHKLIGL